MKSRLIVTALIALLSGACSGNTPPVSVIGSRADLNTLAGEWVGSYEVTDGLSRRGTVDLTLDAGQDTARGAVVMTTLQARGSAGIPQNAMPAPMAPFSEALSIKFVRVNGNVINGVLDPYRDPNCGCTLTTTFVGRLKGDEIEGTFTVRHSDSMQRETGWWRATRSKVK